MICVKDDHLNCELFCVRPDQTANFKTKVDLIGKFFYLLLKKVIVYFHVIIYILSAR